MSQGPAASSGSTEAPPDLEARGLALWDGYVRDRPTLAPGERVLLHEACRTADRLDRLAGLLSGEDEPWARVLLPRSEDDDLMRLEVSSALVEARQQQNGLRLTLTSLEAVRGLTGQAANGQTPPTPEADPVDEFSRRRADRRGTGTAGS